MIREAVVGGRGMDVMGEWRNVTNSEDEVEAEEVEDVEEEGVSSCVVFRGGRFAAWTLRSARAIMASELSMPMTRPVSGVLVDWEALTMDFAARRQSRPPPEPRSMMVSCGSTLVRARGFPHDRPRLVLGGREESWEGW